MKREDFKDCIRKLEAITEFGNKLSDLKIETIECKELFYADEIFFKWVKDEFGEAGEDLVSWWLYEDVDKIVYEKDGTETNLENIDALYTYLLENYK